MKSIGELYRSHFLVDNHKLGIKPTEDYIEKALSNDITITEFPHMVNKK